MSKPLAQTVKQKGSLNAKAKLKQTFKFVITQPYPDFWPAITNDETSELKTVLNKLAGQENLKESVQFGMTSILRAIKNSDSSLTGVAISLNFKPYFITKQLINLALTKNYRITIVLVENLEAITKDAFGFESSSVGFKNINANQGVAQFFGKISQKYPTPKFEAPAIGENIVKKPEKVEKMDEDFDCDSVYLKKIAGSRAFIPETVFLDKTDRIETPKRRKIKKEPAEMIAFNKGNLYQDTFVIKVRKKN